jgi:hypothetical protein
MWYSRGNEGPGGCEPPIVSGFGTKTSDNDYKVIIEARPGDLSFGIAADRVLHRFLLLSPEMRNDGNRMTAIDVGRSRIWRLR